MGTEGATNGTGLTRRGAAATIGALITGSVAGLGRESDAALAQATPPSAPPLPADFGVVFHVSADGHWPYALSNLENLAASHPAVRIRVVVDGTGVYALQGPSDVVGRLDPLAAQGIRLEVCPNALREHRIEIAAMPAFADTSLGGVVALALAQREGFAYVKP